jgi:hypothetical protein
LILKEIFFSKKLDIWVQIPYIIHVRLIDRG